MNQGHEIVGADGKVVSDQQYRGFRWWSEGGGSRTSNNHFTRDVFRADGTKACVGYGVDGLSRPCASGASTKCGGDERTALSVSSRVPRGHGCV